MITGTSMITGATGAVAVVSGQALNAMTSLGMQLPVP
jgi:hypothetical protein